MNHEDIPNPDIATGDALDPLATHISVTVTALNAPHPCRPSVDTAVGAVPTVILKCLLCRGDCEHEQQRYHPRRGCHGG